MKISIVLTGSAELNRKLASLSSKEAKEAIRKAARPALKNTLSAARSLAPKRSGALSRSIKIRSITRSRSRIGARVTTSASDNLYTGKSFYGAFQEFGWKTGSRRNTLERATRRHARLLRQESRAAGGLKKKGTEFRARQERYFRDEGARRALSSKSNRTAIPGKHYMQRAADKTRDGALKIYREAILAYILSVTSR